MPETLNNVIVESLRSIPLDQIPVAIAFLSVRIMTEPQRHQQQERGSGTDLEKLLTAKQLALQLNVPESWVRTEQRAGRIPAVRLGKYVRFRRAEVDATLAKGPP